MPEQSTLSDELHDEVQVRTHEAVSSLMAKTEDLQVKYWICIAAMMHVAGMTAGVFTAMHPEYKDIPPEDILRGIVKLLLEEVEADD